VTCLIGWSGAWGEPSRAACRDGLVVSLWLALLPLPPKPPKFHQIRQHTKRKAAEPPIAAQRGAAQPRADPERSAPVEQGEGVGGWGVDGGHNGDAL
jgi:hypothetical protein